MKLINLNRLPTMKIERVHHGLPLFEQKNKINKPNINVANTLLVL